MSGGESSQSSWGKMQCDVLVKIFMYLPLMDLITGVAGVCRSWRSALRDPLLWEKVDFTDVMSHPVIARQAPYWVDARSRKQFKILMKTVAKFSGDAVTNLYFNFFIFLDDKHIALASRSFPNLKRFALPGWNRLNEPGLIISLTRWTNLESLIFPCLYSPVNVMRFLGEHCKNFTKLKMVCTFDYSCAEAVVNHLPNLKVLSLRSALVYKDALEHLLDNATGLLSLNIAHCLLFELALPPTLQQLNLRPVLGSETIEKARRLEKFMWCDRTTCPRCVKIFVNEEGDNRWVDFQDDIWCDDEFTEFVL